MRNEPTQKERVLILLERHGTVCANTLLGERIPRAAARVWELRDEGYPIVTEACDNRYHSHVNPQKQYRLTYPGEQGVLL